MPPSRIVAALDLLRVFDQSWWFRSKMEKWVQANEASTIPETKQACAAIRQRLKQEWLCYEDYPALFERCAAAVTNPGKTAPYGSPESERPLVWAVLTDLASRQSVAKLYGFPPPQPFPKERRASVAEEALRVALHGPDDEREEVATLLLHDTFQPAVLPEDFWEKMFLNPRPRVWRPAAGALLRRNQRERLFELALQHDAKTQTAIIWAAMKSPDSDNPRAPLEMGSLEIHFLETLWDRAPKEAIGWLTSACGYTDMIPAPLAFRQRILDYLDGVMPKGGTIQSSVPREMAN